MLEDRALHSMSESDAKDVIDQDWMTLFEDEVEVLIYVNLFWSFHIHWETPLAFVQNWMVIGDDKAIAEFDHLNFLVDFSDQHAENFRKAGMRLNHVALF